MPEANPSPVRDRRIVVTRASAQCALLVELLTQRGAHVTAIPLVEFAEPADWAPLDYHLAQLAAFDWLLFTSENAVHAVAARMQARKLALPAKPSQQVAAVGPATAAAAQAAGFPVTHQAHTHSGLALARELKYSVNQQSIFLPRSDRARRDLPEALKSFGARVTEVTAYRTICPMDVTKEKLRTVLAGSADAILFFSPSAVENFVQTLGCNFSNLPEGQSELGIVLSAVGPITAAALTDAGSKHPITSPDTTPLSVVESLEKFFATRETQQPTPHRAGVKSA
ncbi:MAG TPA: uroporphyrinogen-III synthase [Candidatus Saccharimonadales bacterium]|nr:uroporphyrinogen-III synthase [Candidatus Saccharimonadales bacterium]